MANFPSPKTDNRRVFERKNALDVQICLVELGDNRSAMLLDVSELGIGVQSVDGPSANNDIHFRFLLPDTDTIITGEGELAWADRAGRMGIRFTRIAPEMQAAVHQWVNTESNPLFAGEPVTETMADLDARDRVAQLEARIIVSGWAQLQALNFLVDQIAAMTQASGVAIAVEDGSGIVCKASSGIAPQVGVRVNPRSGLSWECVRTNDVVHCVDTETDPRVDRIVCRELKMRSAMLVPVKKDGHTAGVVEVFSSRAHAFNNGTVILLRRVAEAVAALDETAVPLFDEEPLPQQPVAEPKPATAAKEVAAPLTPELVPEKKTAEEVVPTAAPVAIESVQPAMERIAASTAAKIPVATEIAPPKIAFVTPPVEAAPAEPVAVVAPQPLEAKPVAAPPVIETIPMPAVPLDQPPVVERKPIEAPVESRPVVIQAPVAAPAAAVPPQVSKPAVAAQAENPPEVAPAVARQVVTAPPVVVAKAAEIPAAAKTMVEKSAAVVPPAPPIAKIEVPVVAAKTEAKPAPVVAETKAPDSKIPERETVKPKPPQMEPVRTPAMRGPLPAVAFSGAAAAAPKLARTVETANIPAAKIAKPEPQTEESPSFKLPLEESRGHGRAGWIAAIVLALVGGIGYGTWKYLESRPVQSPPAQAAVAPPPIAAQPPVLSNAPAATAPLATAPPAAAKPQPVQTAPPSTVNTDSTIAESRVVPAPPNAGPVRVATPRPKQAPDVPPAAPPLTIASSNSNPVAGILNNPVAAPSLSHQSVSQGISGGKQIVRVQPAYPAAARTMRVSGTVTLRVHVTKTGKVSAVEVVNGHALLNEAAVEAVRRWKYEPLLLNGQPIENDVTVQVKFDLPR